MLTDRFAKSLADRLFRCLDHVETGSLTLTTPDGQTRVFSGDDPGEVADIQIHDWRVFLHLIFKGDVGFANDYRFGYWESNDPVALAGFFLRNRSSFDQYIFSKRLLHLAANIGYQLRRNTMRGSKKNIQAHYDLGNNFYALWLDPSMTYSSALFRSQEESLEAAQGNKYNRIIKQLGSSSGRLLDIGCGWGGFAAHAASCGDFAIQAITLSQEQCRYAQQRLGDGARVFLRDYRSQDGIFDHIVSIEMFEAVGESHWPVYFRRIGDLLKQGGRAVIQTITINNRDFPRYRRESDFIRSYIFPGGLLPSPERFEQEAEKAGLRMDGMLAFGQDYARTVTHWLQAFDDQRPAVKALGFDDGFIRLWRFYLSACIAGFKTGHNDVMQINLSHA